MLSLLAAEGDIMVDNDCTVDVVVEAKIGAALDGKFDTEADGKVGTLTEVDAVAVCRGRSFYIKLKMFKH